MFIVYRATSSPAPAGWENETRYLLDRVIFWTMPTEDLYEAEAYWENIRQNILQDTLQNQTNTFWKIQDKRNFHVRPKAQKGTDRYYSSISHVAVPKKAYWFNQEYVKRIIEHAYDEGESSKIN